ncbi:MAG TPA: hypothetical protein VGP31_09945 [Planosporangium sp.]|nr:hypothetical protein [Planosporangium sp.]
MNAQPSVATEPAPSIGSGWWLPWVGMVVAVALAAVSAVWEAFLTPLAWHWTSGGHGHFVRVPVALLCAVAGNAALAWFTRTVTGKMLAVLAPFIAWTVPMVLAAGRTREGDLVLTSNNWVGLTTMFAGALSFAVTVYWLTIRSLRRPA